MKQWNRRMLAAVMAVLVLTLAACGGTEPRVYTGKLTEKLDEENKPNGITVAQGTYLDVISVEEKKTLNQENGRYLLYYVENWGDTTLAISIDDVSSDPIKPGECGYLVMEVTNVVGIFPREYSCEVNTLEGGFVSVKQIVIQGELEEFLKWEKEA